MDQLLSLHRGLLLGCMLLSGSVVFAQAPAQAPPPLFMRDGRISTVNLTEDMITVNDLLYYLSPAVRVYTYDRSIKDPQALRAETRLKDGRALREGMRIGYTVAGEGGGKRGELTEAWILPPGSMPELDKSGKSAAPSVAKAAGKAQRAQPGK
jgi:hypothetical protein